MIIQGQVQNVSVKRSGNTNGRNWSIYEVTINGQKFSTFDNGFMGMIGQSGAFEYEVTSKNVNGKIYTDNRLAPPKKTESKTGAGTEILRKLDIVIDMLRELTQQKARVDTTDFVPAEILTIHTPPEDEIDVSQIPF